MFKKILQKHGSFLLALGAAICLCFFFYIAFFPESKTPATPEQMWDVFVSQGYEPHDATQRYIKEYPNAEDVLICCYVVETDDLHFEYHNFNNDGDAFNIYQQARSYLYDENAHLPSAETEKSMSNFSIYTITAGGKYSVAIWVGNTAIYAYCDEENASLIDEIRKEIGYTP